MSNSLGHQGDLSLLEISRNNKRLSGHHGRMQFSLIYNVFLHTFQIKIIPPIKAIINPNDSITSRGDERVEILT